MILTPIGTETDVPNVIKKNGIMLIKPIEYCGLSSIFNPANKKIKVAGKLINKPIPEDVPTAFFISLPQLSNKGTLRVPPPIPKSEEIVAIKKLIIF